jgi:hypothetical protein
VQYAAKRVETVGVLALYPVAHGGKVGLRAVAERIERVIDVLVEEIGNRRQAMRGVVGVREGRAIGQGGLGKVARRVIGEGSDARPLGRSDGAGQKPLACVIA